jgi:hypothetical protein
LIRSVSQPEGRALKLFALLLVLPPYVEYAGHVLAENLAEFRLPGREVRAGLAAAGIRNIRIEHLMFFPPKRRWTRPLEDALRWLPCGGQYVAFGEKP